MSINKPKPTNGSASQASGHLINEQIKAPQLRVITEDGQNIGVVSRSQALMMANAAGLDLVQISREDDETPVAKVMDFGKFLYEKKKQQHESKKHQKVIQIKEIKLRPNIGEQDYLTKLKQAVQFLVSGKKVKVTLQFRGREIIMMDELGNKIFTGIAQYFVNANIGPVLEEKESKSKPLWSKIYYIKEK